MSAPLVAIVGDGRRRNRVFDAVFILWAFENDDNNNVLQGG
jgi:hypothetical protein